MRALAVSPTHKISASLTTLLLTAGLTSVPAIADEVDSAAGDAPMLASLMASGAGHISTAVALEDEPEPIVGSFTMDGLTYVILDDTRVMLVSVDSDAVFPAGADDLSGAEGAGRGIGSGWPTSPQPQLAPLAEASNSESDAEETPDSMVMALPESVDYDSATYVVTAIGPKALEGCDADVVAIPATFESVNELAFRGSLVASVEVAEGNPNHSSYDGVLYDADQSSLLLIPEGKQGAVRIPKSAESVPPSAFSHCALVTSVSADAGSAAFSSRNGCLYDASGTTLLRVPAGATDVEIADGCTTVAASALEGCAKLRSIQAPAGIVEVSSDVLGASLLDDEASVSDASNPAVGAPDDGAVPVEGRPEQLTSLFAPSGMVADACVGIPTVDPASVPVRLPSDADPAPWEALGFAVEMVQFEEPSALEGEPMGVISAEAIEGDPLEAEPDPVEDAAAGEVTVEYGYANERTSADGAYERAVPKVVATLRLQPLVAEGLAAEPMDEGSLATASFLYEGCLYVIDPEGGAALVAVDPKRLAECVEDPTTLVLPDYVDDGQWAYPLTRIAKGPSGAPAWSASGYRHPPPTSTTH